MVADGPVGQEVADLVEEPQPGGHALALAAAGLHRLGDAQAEMVDAPLQPVGVLDAHLQGGQQVLPDARRRHDEVGADLAQVALHRLGLLGDVDGEADLVGQGQRPEGVADPGHGQVGHQLVVGAVAVHLQQPLADREEVAVAEHGPLGEAGGARGVGDDGHVLGAGLLHLLLEVVGVLGIELPPHLLHLGQAQEPGVAVVAHPFGVVVDDLLHVGQLLPQGEELVHLLLVFGQDELGLRVVDDVLHLAGDGVLVDGHGHSAQRLGGHEGPVELGAVVADDGQLVAPLEAQDGQPQGQGLDVLVGVGPGVGLPDAELLLAHGGLAGEATGVVQKQLGDGVHA